MARTDEARAYERDRSVTGDPSSVSAVVESPRRVLEILRSYALDRFSAQERTLTIFFDEIRRELEVRASANGAAAIASPMPGAKSEEAAPSGSGDELDDLLLRLEDFLDSLLMGDKRASLR